MDAAQIIAFNVALLAAMAAPGPALLYAIRQSVAGGIGAGIATGAGLGLVAALWTGAALLGLGAVFALVPWAYLALKLAGAAYLIWVAWGLWRDASQPLSDTAVPTARAFVGGVMVNLSNPKTVLFAASVLVVIFPAGLHPAEMALIVLNHFVIEVAVYTGVALLLASPPARAGYLRLKPVFDRIAAAVLGVLGLRLMFDR